LEKLNWAKNTNKVDQPKKIPIEKEVIISIGLRI